MIMFTGRLIGMAKVLGRFKLDAYWQTFESRREIIDRNIL